VATLKPLDRNVRSIAVACVRFGDVPEIEFDRET
jgi:hypothetical protein